MAIEAQQYSENLGFAMLGSRSQGLMVDNSNGSGGFGFGFNNEFYFNPQQKLPPPLVYQPPLLIPGTLVPAPHNNDYKAYTHQSIIRQNITAQEAKQSQEIDEYLRLQNERLRLVLQEQRKQQLALLLKKIESKTEMLMRHKDEEIEQAVKKRIELEGFLRKMEDETQAWQRVAQKNEAMVISLNKTLEQHKERAAREVMEEAESCCGTNQKEEKQEEQDTRDYSRRGLNSGVNEQMKMLVCKGCNSKRSCVLFLPCRHLCACQACEAGFDACPVCSTPKKASIKTLIF